MKNKKIIEMLFWVLALTAVLFINISPQALKNTNPAFLVIFLVALLAILSTNFLPKLSGRNKKIIFSLFVYSAVFFALFLFFKGFTNILVYAYLPALIAFTMAFIVIVQPKGSITTLIAVCTFLLGEAFWNIHIGQGNKVLFPPAFIRVYSLSLVALFGYFLYNREIKMQAEMVFLNERLKKLDAVKSEFVANVSHELRTPLTSIKNACTILRKTVSQPQAKEMLDIIDSNADRQSRLVNNLLDLAKIEKGNLRPVRTLIDLAVLAKQIITSLTMAADAKGITIEFFTEPRLPGIYVSSDQMLEVYSNLIDNAIKYTPKGGNVSIKIQKYQGGIKSMISDTGIGINEKDIPKLFDRFRRLDAVVENRGKGAGLGLAIVKEIVDAHSGKIWVESMPGKGSCFIFTLPVGLRRSDLS